MCTSGIEVASVGLAELLAALLSVFIILPSAGKILVLLAQGMCPLYPYESAEGRM
jgi:hypothetical protein